MGLFTVGRIGFASRVALGFLALTISSSPAQDDPGAKNRLEFMQAAVESLEPKSEELKSKPALTMSSKPLLRYSDPTRGGSGRKDSFLLDAAIWRLGTEGRPTALVTVEIYQAPDKVQSLSFEFFALSDARFSLKHKTKDVRWDPAISGLKLKDLPDAPKLAATPAARLTQMRQFSRRFTAKERLFKDTVECRLIAQPIDRYQSEARKIVDGAIFALANGTNPEIGILLESDGDRWKYGTLRLTSAEVSVSLDDREVEKYENYPPQERTDGPYHYAFYKIGMGK